MSEAGLLGVGSGVTQPQWFGKQETAREKNPSSVAPKQNISTAAARDTRIVNGAILELGAQVSRYSQAVDLDNILANTTQDQDVTVTETGLVESGDYIVCMGGATLNHGIFVQATIPAPANDTIRLRYSNVTSGAINPASMTLYFLVIKPTSIV